MKNFVYEFGMLIILQRGIKGSLFGVVGVVMVVNKQIVFLKL